MIDLREAGLSAAARLSLAGGASTMAAWAARRAARMKFDLPAGSGMTGGRASPSAASEAAMRSAGVDGPRPRTTPGSSGWSGGRSGSIGRRSTAGAGLPVAAGFAVRAEGATATGFAAGTEATIGGGGGTGATHGGAGGISGGASVASAAATGASGGANSSGAANAAAGAFSGILAPLARGDSRSELSMVASRSTTSPSVPCTASSESCVRWTSRVSASLAGAGAGAR